LSCQSRINIKANIVVCVDAGHTHKNRCHFLSYTGISPEASVHLSSPERVTDIRPGVDVILKCKAEGTPELTYEWFR